MPFNKNINAGYCSFVFCLILLSQIGTTQAQNTVKGTVIYDRNAAPAMGVTVELLHHRGTAAVTNSGGNFSLKISESDNNDTLEITSVGYKRVRIPVSGLRPGREFRLTEDVKSMENVTVFNKSGELGSTLEKVGYYRGWNYDSTGGEIGRVIKTKLRIYKIDKIRFKAANFCDTCLVRLRIRSMENELPGKDLLTDSVSIYVNKLTLDGKAPEFDLTPYDLTFTNNELFISFEVLHCGKGKKIQSCSFSFAGSDKGEYLYRSKRTDEFWKTSTDDYSIYVKMALRY